MMRTIRIVVDIESDPPVLLGTLMPAWPEDENVVRYFDSGPDEQQKLAPEDCVQVVAIEV